jgi:hypothetical protein
MLNINTFQNSSTTGLIYYSSYVEIFFSSKFISAHFYIFFLTPRRPLFLFFIEYKKVFLSIYYLTEPTDVPLHFARSISHFSCLFSAPPCLPMQHQAVSYNLHYDILHRSDLNSNQMMA